MSACISSHGEYGSHQLGTEGSARFACEWCGAFDESELLDRLAALEAAVTRVEALATKWESSNFAAIWRDAAELRAALDGPDA